MINVRQTSGSLIKVRLKIVFAPLLWEGLGEGRSYGKEKSKLHMCAGFQPARDIVLDIDSVAAPLP